LKKLDKFLTLQLAAETFFRVLKWNTPFVNSEVKNFAIETTWILTKSKIL